MGEGILGSDALIRIDPEHLLHAIVELCIPRPDDLLESLAVAHMSRLSWWEAVWVLQLAVHKVWGFLADHLGWDLATDVVDEAQVLVSVVNREEKVRGVELQQHTADAPQVCWERPT